MTTSDITNLIAPPGLRGLAPTTATTATGAIATGATAIGATAAIGRVLAAFASLAILADGTALAQPGGTAIEIAPAASPAPDVPDVPERADKSAAVSLGLAIGGTLASIGVLAAGSAMDSDPVSVIGGMGLLVSPSLGHMYTGAPWRSAAGIALRGAGVGAAYYGITLLVQKSRDCQGCFVPGNIFFFGGSALMIGSALYDFIDAPFSAWRHNRRERALTVTPAPIAGPGGSTGFGLQLDLSFR